MIKRRVDLGAGDEHSGNSKHESKVSSEMGWLFVFVRGGRTSRDIRDWFFHTIAAKQTNTVI